ncbi:hypothetical protein HYALB_00004096, partial [Hymenoscyphus albidus]
MFSPTTFLGAFAATVAIVTAEFISKCETPVLETGFANRGIMTAQCMNDNGHYIVTSIDLNACLNNYQGKLYMGRENSILHVTPLRSRPRSNREDPEYRKHAKRTSLPLDLADLSTIAPAITAFLAREKRLDVLFNNAGRASMPLEYKTVQGHEPHFGINCAGTWLVTHLLAPILQLTAKVSPPNTIRITWTASVLVDIMAPLGGVVMKNVRNPSTNRHEHYSASKAGNYFLASEWHRRFGVSGIISLALNPGSLKTNTWRSTPWYHYWPYYFFLGEALDGARTNLWAAFKKGITSEDGG